MSKQHLTITETCSRTRVKVLRLAQNVHASKRPLNVCFARRSIVREPWIYKTSDLKKSRFSKSIAQSISTLVLGKVISSNPASCTDGSMSLRKSQHVLNTTAKFYSSKNKTYLLGLCQALHIGAFHGISPASPQLVRKPAAALHCSLASVKLYARKPDRCRMTDRCPHWF